MSDRELTNRTIPQSIHIYSYLSKSMKNINRFYGGSALSESEVEEASDFVKAEFGDFSEIPVKGNPEKLISGLQEFYSNCEKLYEKGVMREHSKRMIKVFIDMYSRRINASINSGYFSGLSDMGDNLKLSLNLLASDVFRYQRLKRYE